MPHRGSKDKKDGSTTTGGSTTGIFHVGTDKVAHHIWKNENIPGEVHSTTIDHFPIGKGNGSHTKAATYVGQIRQGVWRDWWTWLTIEPSGCINRKTPGRDCYRVDDPGTHWEGGLGEGASWVSSSWSRGLQRNIAYTRVTRDEWQVSVGGLLALNQVLRKPWSSLDHFWTSTSWSKKVELRSRISLILRAMWTQQGVL